LSCDNGDVDQKSPTFDGRLLLLTALSHAGPVLIDFGIALIVLRIDVPEHCKRGWQPGVPRSSGIQRGNICRSNLRTSEYTVGFWRAAVTAKATPSLR
jgi:hypothetical protein